MVGKRQLIDDVNDVASYTVLHNSTHVLRRGPLVLSVVEGIGLIGKKAKSYARRYFKTMGKNINQAFHAWVVIERVAVKVAELRGVPF